MRIITYEIDNANNKTYVNQRDLCLQKVVGVFILCELQWNAKIIASMCSEDNVSKLIMRTRSNETEYEGTPEEIDVLKKAYDLMEIVSKKAYDERYNRLMSAAFQYEADDSIGKQVFPHLLNNVNFMNWALDCIRDNRDDVWRG